MLNYLTIRFIKNFISVFFFFKIVLGQINTEVYLFDLILYKEKYEISNPINISDNNGYDNQPYFLKKSNDILFSSTRNGQTDIVRYNIKDKKKKWITNTKGSEYSPIQIGNSDFFSAIRLDENGDQFLYKYHFKNDIVKLLVPNLKIGYYSWVNDNQLLSFVLGDPPSMQSIFLKEEINKIIDENIGRSFHKIPGTDLMSFIKKDRVWSIMSIDLKTGHVDKIIETLEGSEDFSWTPQKVIFMGKGNKMFKYDPYRDNKWIFVTDLSLYGLSNITRIAISNDASRLAIVVENN